ncbi:hypothetical protein LCGC14_2704980 [marine sediment metagenome]|uniref:Uncharacterized protein n=1 Tax=marine sediment metagenome TaxID=412755 RepID=A0A0F9BNR5_9ZZZZ
MLRSPLEGFLRQLLWFLSREDGLAEEWRIKELYAVKRVRQEIREKAELQECLMFLDDIDNPLNIYGVRVDNR